MGPRVVVVGGGIIGLAAAWRLQQAIPGARITVLEREPALALHQSSHNSGVLHCGLYYRPGSYRARLAVKGIRQMVDFCRAHGVPHEICGKVVVAARPDEVPRLYHLFDRGCQNGLRGLRLLTAEELKEIEPHAAGVAAILVSEEGIVDYPRVCATLARLVREQGGTIATSAEVTALRRDGASWRVEHRQGETAADFLVTCAGLYADRVAALGGWPRAVRIVPFRGDYYLLRPERQHLVRNLIYPVPDPRLPFLGVHFTRRIGGGIEAGPNAVLALSRSGYRKGSANLRDSADALLYPGLWRFLRNYGSVCFEELRRSFSRRLFCESLQRLVPEIRESDLVPGGSGVRAQALGPDGALLDDFYFVAQAGALHVVNAPSPGATASLAIGEEIARRARAMTQ